MVRAAGSPWPLLPVLRMSDHGMDTASGRERRGPDRIVLALVRDQQPVRFQPRVQLAGQGLPPAALDRRRDHSRSTGACEPHSLTVTPGTSGTPPDHSMALTPQQLRFVAYSAGLRGGGRSRSRNVIGPGLRIGAPTRPIARLPRSRRSLRRRCISGSVAARRAGKSPATEPDEEGGDRAGPGQGGDHVDCGADGTEGMVITVLSRVALA